MRLGRSVFAGLVAGAVAGFLVALLRPRSSHPGVVSPGSLPQPGAAPLIEPSSRGDVTDLPSVLPAVVPAQASGEPAVSAPGTSRRIDPGDGAGAHS
jgi:hypothetical protein